MKFNFFVVMIVTLLMMFSVGEAAKVDIYRNALINRSFTLKYEIITPPTRQINKSATIRKESFFKSAEVVDRSHETLRYSGIVVVNGDNKYLENSFGICKLVKDDKVYNFHYNIKNNKKHYYGKSTLFGSSKKVKVQDGEQVLPYADMFEEYNYNSALFEALGVIIPTNKIIATPQTPQYKFLGSGTLPNGLSYEDFSSVRDNIFFAARYYFDGNNLVKISVANCTEINGKIVDYEKTIVAIKEFSTTPDESYLSLPKELEEKNK